MSKVVFSIFLLGLILLVVPLGAEGLNLNQCIEMALKNSPELEQKQIDVRLQKVASAIESANFHPGLDLGTDRQFQKQEQASHLKLDQKLPQGFGWSAGVSHLDPANGADVGKYTLGLSKTLIGPNSSSSEVRNVLLDSLIDETVALNRWVLARRIQVFDVTRAYYAIVRSVQTKKIQELRQESALKNLEHARERDNPMDIATAELEVPEKRIAILHAERNRADALDNLKRAMGWPMEKELEIDVEFPFAFIDLDPGRDRDFLLESHEDLLNLELELKKIDMDFKNQRRRIWPEVSMEGSVSKDSRARFDFDGVAEQSLALKLKWPLGSRSERAGLQRLEMQSERKKLELLAARQDKDKSLRALARQLEESRESILLQRNRVKLGQRQAELFRDRWENGEIDILELIRSQNSLQNSELSMITLETSYLELVAEYRLLVPEMP